MTGVTPADVELEVRRVLTPQLARGVLVQTHLSDRSGEMVVVGVEVQMASATPDLLWPIGFGLKGRNIYSETRMIRE